MKEGSMGVPELTPAHPEQNIPASKDFTLQTPREFRDDLVTSIGNAKRRVGLETMQFEICEDTIPIFDAIEAAKKRGVEDVRFKYDRVARKHIRVGKDQAWTIRGRTVLHRGDKKALRSANIDRENLIQRFEETGITDPVFKKSNGHKFMSHNHVKLAIVDDVAWFGTMNLRAEDFEMSNFMIKVTNPHWVGVLKEIFDDIKNPKDYEDKVFKGKEGQSGETEFLLDCGARKQSIIYDKALEMASMLKPGDKFAFISQWPPTPIMFGDFLKTLEVKTQNGTQGSILMNPADDLHPFATWSRAIQTYVNNKYKNNSNLDTENLPRKTHAKAFIIEHKDGSRELLIGSHNLSSFTVRNGTRELAIWSRDPSIVDQFKTYLKSVKGESVLDTAA